MLCKASRSHKIKETTLHLLTLQVSLACSMGLVFMDHAGNANKAGLGMLPLYCPSLEGTCGALSFSRGRELKFFTFYFTSGTISKVEVAVIPPEDWPDLLQELWPSDFLKLYSQKS